MSEQEPEKGPLHVYQADPHTCVSVARKALWRAECELNSETPDLQQLRTHLGVVRAWLPSWLERAWDDQMASWLEQENARELPALDE